ncbi:MAG: Flp pilus assembly protein CpaB [Candidatus Desulforudis sp.]|nr:Flp pilus assembly protein CpaB [Desulforudis sp.]
MPNWLSRRVLIIALLLSIAAAAAAYYYLSTSFEQKPVNVRTGETMEIVVAVQEIPAQTRITREMVNIRKVPVQYAQPGAAISVDQVAGRIAIVSILGDEQVTTSKLAGEGMPKKRLSYNIPEGYRAITIPVNEIKGVAGFPTVGDRVDVLISRGTPVATQTLLQNVDILATGSVTIPQDDGEQRVVPTFTLSVTPQQAQIITLAEKTVDVRLILRSPVDEEVVSIPPTTEL